MIYRIEIWRSAEQRWVMQPESFPTRTKAANWLRRRNYGAEARAVGAVTVAGVGFGAFVIAGVAFAQTAFGGVAIGHYAKGGAAVGTHVVSSERVDDSAAEWFTRLGLHNRERPHTQSVAR